MPRIKITCYMDVDDEVADPNHESGLTNEGFERVHQMLLGFDDIETEPA